MSSKLIQKFLIFIFTAVFFVILAVGIGRARKVSIEQAVVPIVPANIPTASVTPTAQKEPSASQPPPVKEPVVAPPAPIAPTISQEPLAVQPPPVKQKPKNLKFTGTTYGTPFGQVTVAIDVSNGKLISVDTPDYPDSGPSIYARPYLIDQALSTGSANIQGVSGATYTSFAFQHSLESAIVSAGANLQ